MPLGRLTGHLGSLEAGSILCTRRKRTMELVRRAWPFLAAPESAPVEFPREVRALVWYPPVLKFRAVRDRGFHDVLQAWTIDVEEASRTPGGSHFRVRAEHVARLADELADAIREKRLDDRLQWSATGSVRVLRRGLFPPAGSYTTDDRFERLGFAIEHRLGPLYRRLNGWWQAPQPTDPERLPGLIIGRAEDVRIRRGRRGVRIVLRNVFPDEIGVTRERRRRVRDVLTRKLGPLGWSLGDDGWWSPPPYYRGLGVCRECGLLAGPHHSSGGRLIGTQRCACDPLRGKEERWGEDFNMVGQLCQCCAQELLPSGSRWSVWFCSACKDQVRLLNARLGRYAVPIGRHSMMGDLFLTADSTALDNEIFCSTFNSVIGAIYRLEAWSRDLTRRLVEERWPDGPGVIPIEVYRDRCVTTEEEKMRRFREMMAFLSKPVASDDRRSRPGAGA